MARGDQLARQWKIVQILITSRMGKSAADLARDLECHPRTLYRDLDALQAAGFPMYTEKINGKSLWSLLDTVKHHFPIPFTLPELMALYFGRDVLKVLKGTVFYDSLESLFGKIKTTLPPETRQYLKEVEKSLKAGPTPYKQYDRFKEIIHQANEAVIRQKYVDMTYFTMSRRKMTRRRVAPYKIWYHEGTFYLIGHCILQNEVRIFALDRIRMLNLTDESFEVPEDFNVDEFMQTSFGVYLGEPVRVKVWFAPDVAGYIKEKIWHESQQIHEQKDGSVVFEAEVAGTDEIKFWILSWGAKALVLEPDSLREEIKTETASLMETYSNGLGKERKLSA